MNLKNRPINQALHKTGLCLTLFFATFYFNFNAARNTKFFMADDWAWLYRAETSSIADIFSILPVWIYNDRPIGALLIKFEYLIFGLDFEKFQIVHVMLHSANAVLFFLICQRLLSRIASLISALFFSLYLPANDAVFWVAAVFDLFGLTLILVSILLLIDLGDNSAGTRRIVFASCLFFLAARTKETYIVAPLIFLMIHFSRQRASQMKFTSKIYLVLLPVVILGVKYVVLFFEARSVATIGEDPYKLTFTNTLSNVTFYLNYFNPFGSLPVMLISVVGVVLALNVWFFREIDSLSLKMIPIGFLGFFILLSPLLVLGSQQSRLYLYAPHLMLGLALGGVIDQFKDRAKYVLLIMVMVLLQFTWSTQKEELGFANVKSSYVKGVWDESKPWMSSIDSTENIYISGLEPYFNPFSYGPGYSIRLFTGQFRVAVFLEMSESELKTKFCGDNEKKRFLSFAPNGDVDQLSETEIKCF